MSSATVMVGLQFGDEGKGKIADYLVPDYDICVRFNGGPNAGHTIKHGETTYKLNQLPVGAVHGKQCVIAAGCVVDAYVLGKERARLLDCNFTLSIANNAHVITAANIAKDIATGGKIGTTGRGIGPTYEAKMTRLGTQYDYDGSRIKFDGVDVSELLTNALESGKRVFFEGAQATGLDIDWGTYPYVTSSSCLASYAAVSAGIASRYIQNVVGVMGAYCIRVGQGPFFTQMDELTATLLRDANNEYGTVTGRPRRIGWFDIPMINRAIRLNGVTELALTKHDVLTESLAVTKVCVDYEGSTPIYEIIDAGDFIPFIEERLNAPITMVGTGPDREDILHNALTNGV